MGEGLIDANERYLMKGFKIKINGKSLSIGVNDIGVSSIFINCMDGECHISVRGVDHVTGTRYVWVEEQIEFGQRIEFDFTDIDSESIPLIESDAEVMNIDDIMQLIVAQREY